MLARAVRHWRLSDRFGSWQSTDVMCDARPIRATLQIIVLRTRSRRNESAVLASPLQVHWSQSSLQGLVSTQQACKPLDLWKPSRYRTITFRRDTSLNQQSGKIYACILEKLTSSRHESITRYRRYRGCALCSMKPKTWLFSRRVLGDISLTPESYISFPIASMT
jgi:hypothetical protein